MKAYRGFYIEAFIAGGYTVFCDGDEIWFKSVKEAKAFIDSITE